MTPQKLQLIIGVGPSDYAWFLHWPPNNSAFTPMVSPVRFQYDDGYNKEILARLNQYDIVYIDSTVFSEGEAGSRSLLAQFQLADSIGLNPEFFMSGPAMIGNHLRTMQLTFDLFADIQIDDKITMEAFLERYFCRVFPRKAIEPLWSHLSYRFLWELNGCLHSPPQFAQFYLQCLDFYRVLEYYQAYFHKDSHLAFDNYAIGGFKLIGGLNQVQTMNYVLSRLIARLHARRKNVHVFGVAWKPMIVFLKHLARQYSEIQLSFDSTFFDKDSKQGILYTLEGLNHSEPWIKGEQVLEAIPYHTRDEALLRERASLMTQNLTTFSHWLDVVGEYSS